MLQDEINKKQLVATRYYDKFSKLYDCLSPNSYYHKARSRAVEQLNLKDGMSILNVPVGTGQNFEYFQKYLRNTGLIIGVDVSKGMLSKAEKKIKSNKWENIELLESDVLSLKGRLENENRVSGFDAVLCDLGLSGFPHWKGVINDLISLLNPGGRVTIMDWYIPEPSLKGKFVKWIGKGEVNRPLWQYLETKVEGFNVDSSFNRGGVFVASGTKIRNRT